MKIPEQRFRGVVKPNMAKTELRGWDKEKEAYVVTIKEPADKGKANAALIKYLNKELTTDVRIVSGLTARIKVLEKTR